VLRLVGATAVALLLIGVAGAVYAEQLLQGLPSVDGLDSAAFAADTVVTDRNGKPLADIGEKGNHRLVVPLRDVSPFMVQATVAIEDRNFYKNDGYDLQGIARAALANYRSGQVVGGGSTITQQLAKQLFLTPDQTLQRKVRELALAYQLSHTYSKEQILELYLNKTYYGSQSYGVEAAAQTYFHKDAKQLDLAEAAMLAGLPSAPTEWNPAVHFDAAKLRQREVLDAMVRAGYIEETAAAAAAGQTLSVSPPANTFLAPHFVDYVQAELRSLGFKSGVQELRVKTTLDLDKQALAEKAVRDNLAAQQWRDRAGLLSSAMVAIDPRTGEIVAMVGSPDYNADGGQFNLANLPRNPGSSYKVFNYAAVINSRKATMETPINDGPNPFVWRGGGEVYKVFNYDKRTHGVQPLKRALGNSLNIPAVKAELAVGVPSLVDFSRNLGIYPRITATSADGSSYYDKNAPNSSYGPSLTLGGYPITLVEEATGLATIAGNGVFHPAEAILSVTDARGKTLYTAHPDAARRQALDPGVAFIMASMLSDDSNRAMIFGRGTPLHLADRRAAAKTGTTDDFKDALTIGFTPELASVFWVGDIKGTNHTMVAGSDGVYVAAPAWHSFMEAALSGVPDRWYTPPPDVVGCGFNSWCLKDATSVSRLPGDILPSPTPSPSASPAPAPGAATAPVGAAPPTPSTPSSAPALGPPATPRTAAR
jgi:membrane peptidoglycan carboxypeptidase